METTETEDDDTLKITICAGPQMREEYFKRSDIRYPSTFRRRIAPKSASSMMTTWRSGVKCPILRSTAVGFEGVLGAGFPIGETDWSCPQYFGDDRQQ